jgi:hypothetical protein
MKYNKEPYKILYRRSSSGKGFHFTVFKNGKQLYLPVQQTLRIREQCGDCYGRLNFDKQRIKSKLRIGILFDHKYHKEKRTFKHGFSEEWKYLMDLNCLKF